MITINKQSLNSLLAGMIKDPSQLIDLIMTGITLDSRDVVAGGLFLSLAKNEQQRTQYLQQAVALDAAVILIDAEQTLSQAQQDLIQQNNVQVYKLNNLADKAGEIAARFYGHPSMALTIIAITGTNGKTSVSQFIAQALESLNQPCAVIGTLGFGRLEHLTTTGMTTPDPIRLQAILAGFCQQNIQYVVIEASSHALQQGRLNSVDIDIAVLTNLSHDHLDYHHTMADYAKAKSRLFDFDSVKTVIINTDDDFGQSLISRLSDKTILTYSQQQTASLQANNSQTTPAGIAFNLVSEFGEAIIKSSLLGNFNIDNLLATAASLLALNIEFKAVATALAQCSAVEGRMQHYGQTNTPQVIIDFAHTPDALTQVLQSLRYHITPNSVLWCVFGCGGDRDNSKRALMGSSAELHADKVMLTDDNPRNEDPEAIVNDILSGIKDRQKIQIKHDRKLAITHTISLATAMDVVLIAGKGHEEYQEITGVKYPFKDKDIVVKALQTYHCNLDILAEVQA